jgi:Recombination endonuclease VII
VTYRELRRRHLCTRCRRRRARAGRTKCATCAVQQADSDRVGHQRRKYKLAPGEFEQMWRAQGRRCPACRRRKVRAVVDHHHGKRPYVRVLLCGTCNRCEGFLKRMGLTTHAQLSHWADAMYTVRTVFRWDKRSR